MLVLVLFQLDSITELNYCLVNTKYVGYPEEKGRLLSLSL